MVRAALIGVLIAVGSFIGGLVLLTVSVVAIVGVEESDPAAVASAPVPAATREAPPQEPVPTTADEPADDEAAELQAAEKEAADARRAERAEARAEEGKRIAAEKRAAQEEAAQEAADKKAAEEAAEKAAAEKKAAEEAEKKAAEEAEKRAAEKEAAEKKAEEAAEKKASAGELVTVVAIVDGDTVDVSTGARIRIAGIDTPERGECGYEEAGARMMELARDREGVLVKAGADSIDRYGRLIRYLDVDGRDVGLTLIQEGLAIARYDSRDGYGWHHREAEYVAADAATAQANSCAAPPASEPAPQPAPQPQPFVPQPPAGGATDPQFGTCKEAKANGYGPYIVGVDPEYHWYRDADSDGIVCE